MKNKFLKIILLTTLICQSLSAENLNIEAKNITLEKSDKITIFENDVSIKTANKIIKSDYAKYDKINEEIILKENVIAQDDLKNIIKTSYAEFNNLNKTFKSKGPTILITAENYMLEGEDIFFDSKNKIIKSNKNSILKDKSGNKIFLENFEYISNNNIFKSVGSIRIEDQFNNTYKFSQIYIDTKKKEVLGTDIKAFLNNKDFKLDKRNNPRIFANSINKSENKSSFNKSVFTLCEMREDEKCPPWSLQASKMTHDNTNKTIYYDNAVVKIYNIPIFYFPYLSHPDPTIERRSGFLPPSFSDSKNLGSGVTLPYFWALNEDKNFTLTNKLFLTENPLFLGEYHQALKDANFLSDFGFTEGYKKTNNKKKGGDKSHFFAKYTKNFIGNLNSKNTLGLTVENVSDDKYLKLYKIKSNLVDYNKDVLESSIDFTHDRDDLFFGFNSSMYETLKGDYNDKYEYIPAEIIIGKNLINSEDFGIFDLQTNFKTHTYDTNKSENFFVNNLEWESNEFILYSKFKNKLLGKFKNINYEAKNVDIYKDSNTSELFGALGFLSEIDFRKQLTDTSHLLTPKVLFRFSPGSMRKEKTGSRLTPKDAFNIDRLDSLNNFETGNTAALGFDYSIKKKNIERFNFSVAQIINEKENKKFSDKSSLNEKLSDLVGTTTYNINENLELNHQFSLDQSYKELNYNDFGARLDLGNMNINFNYLEEDKHLGNQEYFKTKINYQKSKKSLFSFETKRNLIKNSSEFYDLSYEYMNDCLRAGLVYRREFYNDSELEGENSLMFKITLTPFGSIDSPKFNQ